jgi:hypothetical protein
MGSHRASVFAWAGAVALVLAPAALATDHNGRSSGKGGSAQTATVAAPLAPKAAPPPAPNPEQVQGVVQSASSSRIVVIQLDGTQVSIAVDSRTKVYVDGRPARLSNVRPGFVLVATPGPPAPGLTLHFQRAG